MTLAVLGLGGLALAVALSLGAFALAGHSLGEPANGAIVPVTSPSRSASNDHSSHPHTPSASPSPDAEQGGSPSSGGGSSPTTAPSSGGSSPSPADDHGGGGHGQDD